MKFIVKNTFVSSNEIVWEYDTITPINTCWQIEGYLVEGNTWEFKRYRCGNLVLYKKVDIKTIIYNFWDDFSNYKYSKINGVWTKTLAPHYVIIIKWITRCENGVRDVHYYRVILYSNNFVLIGCVKDYQQNIIKPSCYPKFPNLVPFTKVLPSIKREVYYNNKIELYNPHLSDFHKPVGWVSEGLKYFYNEKEEFGLKTYKVLSSVKILKEKHVEEYICNDKNIIDWAIKKPRLVSKPIAIEKPVVYYSVISPYCSELIPRYVELNLSLIIYEHKFDLVVFEKSTQGVTVFVNMESETKLEPSDINIDNFISKIDFACNFKINLTDINQTYEDLILIKERLESINLYDGFVKDYNPYNYPIIGKYLEKLVNMRVWDTLNLYQRIKIYKWVINLIVFEIYTICTNFLNQRLNNYMISNFKILRMWAYSRLDISLKQFLVKNKVSITGETYTGFDTEYVPLDYGKNKLVSAQLAFTTAIKLKIPFVKDFVFEGLNTVTSESFDKVPPRFDDLDHFVKYINSLIKYNRLLMFGSFDKNIIKLCNKFVDINRNGLNINDIKMSENCYLIKLRNEPVSKVFISSIRGEQLKIGFDTLNYIVSSRSDEILRNNVKKVKNYINEIMESDSNCEIEKIQNVSFNKPSWNGKTVVQNPLERVYLSNFVNEHFGKEKSVFWSLFEKFFDSSIKIEEYNFVNYISRAGKKLFSSLNKFLSNNLKMEKNWMNTTPRGLGSEKQKQKQKHVSLFTSVNYKNYLLAHYNAADLSLLNDWFDKSFRNIDILKKSFTSLTKPIWSLGKPIYIRDTLLLSSAAASTLDAIGKSHGVPKIEIPKEYYTKMDSLLENNPDLFTQYAMQDSLITLIHGLFMNDFAFNLGNLRLPNTLGSLAVTYLKNKWKKDKYEGYQIHPEYPLGDLQTSLTPKGINGIGSVAEMLSLFTGTFRGGRNECFTYGIDKTTRWYDYDLTSCYSTIMSMCGDPNYDTDDEQPPLYTDLLTKIKSPDYNKIRFISSKDDLGKYDFKNSYSAVKVKFNLPETIKYPPIPVQLDKNITIYPLQGESLITGLEYLSATNILKQCTTDSKKYYITIIYGCYIPFKKDSLYPFANVINELQSNRRTHRKLSGKGSSMERIYKDLGNMLYGKVVCGISNKRNYSSRLEQMTSLKGNFVANPIIGTWITGFVRALLAELLYKTHQLGGKITAVTTDGFVSDIPDLENKIFQYDKENNIQDSFMNNYRDTRTKLSGDPSALEVKTNVRGIIQWSTRGQISLDHTDPTLNNYQIPIAAMTGFQKYHFSQAENVENISNVLGKGNKLLFLTKRLTGALDSYKEKRQVSMLASLSRFRTVYDSKRIVISDNNEMHDTKPYLNIEQAYYGRSLMNALKQGVYSEKYRTGIYVTSPNSKIETLKYFLRLVYGYFDYKMNIEQINQLILLIPDFREDQILSLLAQIKLDKGVILNKMHSFRQNANWFKTLWISVRDSELFDYKFLNILKDKFSNLYY